MINFEIVYYISCVCIVYLRLFVGIIIQSFIFAEFSKGMILPKKGDSEKNSKECQINHLSSGFKKQVNIVEISYKIITMTLKRNHLM